MPSPVNRRHRGGVCVPKLVLLVHRPTQPAGSGVPQLHVHSQLGGLVGLAAVLQRASASVQLAAVQPRVPSGRSVGGAAVLRPAPPRVPLADAVYRAVSQAHPGHLARYQGGVIRCCVVWLCIVLYRRLTQDVWPDTRVV